MLQVRRNHNRALAWTDIETLAQLVLHIVINLAQLRVVAVEDDATGCLLRCC